MYKGENDKLYLKTKDKEVIHQAEGNSKLALLTTSLCWTVVCV